MTDSLKITFAQLNPTVGACRDNANLVLEAYEQAHAEGADLLVCPEMAISGYITEDLVQKPSFMRKVTAEIDRLAQATGTGGPGILFGSPTIDYKTQVEGATWERSCWPHWRRIYNSAVYVDEGKVQAVRHKVRLPDDSVFDDNRVFGKAEIQGPINIRGVRVGAPICEDVWWEEVAEAQAETGAEIVISINGSPWQKGKPEIRQQMAVKNVQSNDLPFVYLALVGGQDDLVFDGGSFALNADCSLSLQMPHFESAIAHTDWVRGTDGWAMTAESTAANTIAPTCDWEQTYECILMGCRDYLAKNGFSSVVLGLSGGIDSALTAVLAVDALGAENVHCVMMPSPYTSQESLDDAAELAKNLGVRLDTINIGPAMQAYETMLEPLFEGTKADTTEENIQSRTRGALLMALSNKFGSLVLTTGNKSEIAVGYATLYGDMCGAYNLIGDLYKMQVFELCRWRNQNLSTSSKGKAEAIIPERIISKPPSAELRPDQKDEDSLPPYPVLDDILFQILERERSLAEIVQGMDGKPGHDEQVVRRVWRLVDIAEYKRRQAAPAVRVSSRGFGKDRRYPITNAHRE